MNRKTEQKCVTKSSWIRDAMLTAGVFAVVSVICIFQMRFDSDSCTQALYILAVAVISLFASNHMWGLFASVMGVLLANLIEYPHFEIDFSHSGYSFAVMLIVSIIITMLTARLKTQNRLSSEMEKAKVRSDLLRSVSHDIRTPLTSISGAASVMLESYDKLSREDIIRLLGDIRYDSEWLIRIVENILTVTRIEDETGKLSKTPEAAEEIISEAVSKFRKYYSTVVDISIPDELMMIPMDALLIEQVLFNLMENSVVHGRTADRISLVLEQKDGQAVFTVADNGAGISEDMMPVLFKDYLTKAEEAPRPDAKRNMGIGLSVCMTIVKVHGGSMTAANNEKGGANFSFTLPMEEE